METSKENKSFKMMDWSVDLKQTLKIKKGRRANKNTALDDIDSLDNKDSIIPNDESTSSSIKFKKTGLWGDEITDKSSKQKGNIIEQERFSSATTNISSMSNDDIPIIPDIDDINDESFLNDIINAPNATSNRVSAYKELDIDLVKQNALASLEDLDLSILTKCLQNDEKLVEEDEVWVWDQLFTEVTAAIHEKDN